MKIEIRFSREDGTWLIDLPGDVAYASTADGSFLAADVAAILALHGHEVHFIPKGKEA